MQQNGRTLAETAEVALGRERGEVELIPQVERLDLPPARPDHRTRVSLQLR